MLAPLFAAQDRSDAFGPERDRLQIMNAVRSALEVQGVHATRAITIEVTSIDSDKAALIANTLADLYILDQLDQKFEATRRASSWLSDRIGQLKEKVRTSEAAIEAFKANQAVGTAQGVDLTDQQIAVALNGGDVGKLATAFADSANAGSTEIHSLGFEQCFIEGGEVEALPTILLVGHITAGTDEIRLADITQLFHFVQQVSTCKHGR